MGSLHEHFGTLPPAPDRRGEARTTPASLAQVEFGGGHSGIILNISELGMAVAVAHVVAVGERLPCVRFLLPNSAREAIQSVEISAEIVWLSESRNGAGMRFLGLSADARNHISNWIASERKAPEFEHLPKPVLRDKRPLEINSGKSRMIFSRQTVCDEGVGARYARMFPSEKAHPKTTATLDEIKQDQAPPFSATSRACSVADVATPDLPAKGSMAGIAQSAAAAFPPERNDKSAAEPSETSNPNEGKPLTTDKPEAHTPDSEIELSVARVNNSSSNSDHPKKSDVPERSDLYEKSAEKGFKLQFAIIGFALVAISFILGLTAGYGPIEKRIRGIGRPVLPVASKLPEPPIVPRQPITSEPDRKSDAPPAEASQPNSEKSQLDSRPALSNSRSSNLDTRATAIEPSLPKSRTKDDSDSSLKTHPPEANSQKGSSSSESAGASSSQNPNPSTPLESKESKPSVPDKNQSEERDDSMGSAAESSSPSARPEADEPVSPPPAVASTPSTPGDSAEPSATPPPNATPTPNPMPRPAPAFASVAIPPAENGKLVRAVFPRKSITGSPSLAITSQLSVLISPAERSTEGDRETARLQAGELISYVVPRQPRPGDSYNSKETVRVRATIGSDGRVTDVKPINGPIFLLSSVVSAVRQWRFHPTLLNGAPVKAEDDVTIEFRLKR
ncbi:MAG: PilZ domain-containing protein [Candidatus Acidiferrales bacterium]